MCFQGQPGPPAVTSHSINHFIKILCLHATGPLLDCFHDACIAAIVMLANFCIASTMMMTEKNTPSDIHFVLGSIHSMKILIQPGKSHSTQHVTHWLILNWQAATFLDLFYCFYCSQLKQDVVALSLLCHLLLLIQLEANTWYLDVAPQRPTEAWNLLPWFVNLPQHQFEAGVYLKGPLFKKIWHYYWRINFRGINTS